MDRVHPRPSPNPGRKAGAGQGLTGKPAEGRLLSGPTAASDHRSGSPPSEGGLLGSGKRASPQGADAQTRVLPPFEQAVLRLQRKCHGYGEQVTLCLASSPPSWAGFHTVIGHRRGAWKQPAFEAGRPRQAYLPRRSCRGPPSGPLRRVPRHFAHDHRRRASRRASSPSSRVASAGAPVYARSIPMSRKRFLPGADGVRRGSRRRPAASRCSSFTRPPAARTSDVS